MLKISSIDMVILYLLRVLNVNFSITSSTLTWYLVYYGAHPNWCHSSLDDDDANQNISD